MVIIVMMMPFHWLPFCQWVLVVKPVFIAGNIYDILTIHTSQTSVIVYQPGAFRSRKFSHHSQPSMHIQNICHFLLLLCWVHMTDWNTSDPGGVEQFHYSVGEATNYLASCLKKKKKRYIILVPTSILLFVAITYTKLIRWLICDAKLW